MRLRLAEGWNAFRPAGRAARRAHWVGAAALTALVLLILVPGIDIAVSRLFFEAGRGFIWRERPVPEFLHEAIQIGARALFAAFLLGLAATLLRRWRAGYERPLLGLACRDWFFLLATLLLAPGLLANTVLKDNWDRARPWQVEAFGGNRNHSPPLVLSDQCDHNCSFVAGDAAVGFYLHAFAYVVRRRSGLVLAAGFAAGSLAGLLRIGMGGHFFSDVVFAGIFMVLAVGLIHALLYGPRATAARWRGWMPWLLGSEGPDGRREGR
ncbi:phosphatase PAP2 family protein [Arenibaculum pallidiluteum]|uniref:phosphatase PAP2 family protein n=1 Tax=Arenibaculum pallidiluteum TaxID=2812559 RepID=UPI001A95995F|nr:phosphatase PAP2 family protein [Arenibaculum pallidiluteum]